MPRGKKNSPSDNVLAQNPETSTELAPVFEEKAESTIEKVINRIKFILRYNEDIIKESINIQVLKIENDAINIDIYVETTVTNYMKYRDFCNKINLTILNILETQGVNLAYPGRNIYIKENSMISENAKFEEKNSLDQKESKSSNKEESKKVRPAKIIK